MARIVGQGPNSYVVVDEAEVQRLQEKWGSDGYLTPKGLVGNELYSYALGPKLVYEFTGLHDPPAILAFLKAHERAIARAHPGYSLHEEGYVDPDEAVNLASARLKDLGIPHTTIVGPVKNGASTGVWILWKGEWLSGVRENAPPKKAIREAAERNPADFPYEFTSE